MLTFAPSLGQSASSGISTDFLWCHFDYATSTPSTSDFTCSKSAPTSSYSNPDCSSYSNFTYDKAYDLSTAIPDTEIFLTVQAAIRILQLADDFDKRLRAAKHRRHCQTSTSMTSRLLSWAATTAIAIFA
uniref:G_PROTEIN_RECEP_F1_2 domain-containing protein n=1 Tax=Panagrellus redivivus TaxID=6233 RepID=A0A7E4V8V8_PANRE